MINKTQNQSFGALRFDRGAKKLKGVRTSMEQAYAKVADTHHVLVQDRGCFDNLLRGFPLVTMIPQAKSKFANKLFEIFPATTVLAHSLLKRPVSRVKMDKALKSESLTSAIADTIEKKIPVLTASRQKHVANAMLKVLTLGVFPRSIHTGKGAFKPQDATSIIDEALINLAKAKPSSDVIYPAFARNERAALDVKLAFENIDTSALDRFRDFSDKAKASLPKNPELAKPISFPNVDTSAVTRRNRDVERILKQVKSPEYAGRR